MKTRNSAALLFLILSVSPGAAQDEWKPANQPDLAKQIDKAAELKVQDVCVPVTSVRLGMLHWAPNPDGKTYDLLQIYFPQYGGPNTIVIMDLGSGEVKYVSTQRGPNMHLCPAVVAPNGKLYMSILDQKLHVEICVYDPAANEFKLNALPIPPDLRGETHPLVLGTDGKVYAAGAHTGKAAGACQIDPETGKVTDLGPIGPSHAPNDCWGYSAAADDRYVYIASGKVPWYLAALDRQTGKSEALVTTENVDGYVSVGQGRYGCAASATKVKGTDGNRIEYWLYQGKAIPKKDRNEAPPWPEPKEPKPWVNMPPRPEVSLAKAVPDAEGNAEIWYRTPEAKAAASPQPAAGTSLEKVGWKVIRLKLPLYPEEIYRLVELPDGRIFGTAGAYEGNFIFDPNTGKSVHMGKCDLSHYATAILDGKIYMSGYPSSPLYVYDPSKPWTAGTGEAGGKALDDGDARSNPRRLLYMNKYAGTHKMYAAAVGADGKVYFGGRWMRNGSAGGLAWYDPKTEKAGGFWEVLSNYQVNFLTTASGGRYVVISTHRIDDPLLGKPKPRHGKLFILDTGAAKIVREIEPVMDAKGAGLVIGVGGNRVLGWTVDPNDEKAGILYGLDVETGKLAFSKTVPYPLPVAIGSNQQERFDYRLGPDGKVWTFIADKLVRIDPKDASILVVGKVPRGGGRLAFSGKDVYLSGSTSLRKIAGILSR